jgi:phage shock protein C
VEKKLYRSHTNTMIAGVCGGIAEYFNIDTTLVRIATVLLAWITSGAGVLLYLAMAFIIPKAPGAPRMTADRDPLATPTEEPLAAPTREAPAPVKEEPVSLAEMETEPAFFDAEAMAEPEQASDEKVV